MYQDRPARIIFPIAPSRTYRIEESANLQAWKPAGGVLTFPYPGLGIWIESGVGPVMGARYFRVLAD